MFRPWIGNMPWSQKWQPTPVFLPGKSHGQRSLAGVVHGATRVRLDLVTTQQTTASGTPFMIRGW